MFPQYNLYVWEEFLSKLFLHFPLFIMDIYVSINSDNLVKLQVKLLLKPAKTLDSFS